MPHPLPLPPGFAPSADPQTSAAIAGMLSTSSGSASNAAEHSQGLAELLRAQAVRHSRALHSSSPLPLLHAVQTADIAYHTRSVGTQAAPVGRKQRELYVGNLPVGMVTPQTLKDLFTAPLRTMPTFDESLGPPVNNCDLSAGGSYALSASRHAGFHLFVFVVLCRW